MQLTEIRDRIYQDCAEAKIANDRIDSTLMDAAVNDAYRDLAARGRCFVGTTTITLIDDVGTYARPLNMLSDFICVRRSLSTATPPITPTPLIKDSRKHMMGEQVTFRNTTKGTPERWFIHEGRFFEVWPKPNTTTGANSLLIEGHLLPSTLGMAAAQNITSSTNASPIVITAAAHGRQTGEWVTVASHLVNTAANGTWRITWVTANTFSLDDSTGNGAGAATGTFTLLGIPPLVQNWDEPQMSEEFHQMLVHGAVSRLLTRFLAEDNPLVFERAKAAREDYESWIPKLLAFYNEGPR